MTNKSGRTSSGANWFWDEDSVEYSYDRCPNPFYFYTPLLIIYFSAIETLICHTEIEVDRVYFLQFYTKYDRIYMVFKIPY